MGLTASVVFSSVAFASGENDQLYEQLGAGLLAVVLVFLLLRYVVKPLIDRKNGGNGEVALSTHILREALKLLQRQNLLLSQILLENKETRSDVNEGRAESRSDTRDVRSDLRVIEDKLKAG